MQDILLELFRKFSDRSLTSGRILSLLENKYDRSTLYRHLQQLLLDGKIEKNGSGKYTTYKFVKTLEEYFSTPYIQRASVAYKSAFLTNYDEIKKPFFTQKEIEYLVMLNEPKFMDTAFLFENKRVLEALLIDFAYSSSYLEGNTYSYLDTQILIESGKVAEGKEQEEAVMILNHKYALEYVIAGRKETKLDRHTVFDVHRLLGKGLIDSRHTGKLREGPVRITGSSYIPPEHAYQLEDAIVQLLEIYNTIRNPFEKSFFILIYIPYLQLFHDINKRTGRTLANLALLSENLAPFAYLGTDRKEYLTALLAIYELHDTSAMKKLYIEAYERVCRHYLMR